MEAGCDQIKKNAGRQVEKEHYLAATGIQESRIKHDLAKSMREEQLAAADYRDRGKYASESGDHKTGQLYEHIAKEEDLHQQEFKKQGQKLSGQYSTTVPQVKYDFHGIAYDGKEEVIEDDDFSHPPSIEMVSSWAQLLKGQGHPPFKIIVTGPGEYKKTYLSKDFQLKPVSIFITVSEPGDTTFKVGEIISLQAWADEQLRVKSLGLRPAKGVSGSRKETASGEIIKEPHPDNGNGGKEIPATIQGEPIPDKYRELTPFIDEPLPPGTDFLLPAVVVQEGERKIDAVLRQLKDGVEGIQDSSQFRLFLTTMSKFHDYSIGNLILIAIQKPVATKVAGFQTWKDLGRWVMKGATGIAILAPIMPPKPKKEEREEEEEEVSLAPVNFKVVHVFDISQTEGKPLPEFDVPVLTGEANEELFAKALALAKAQGVEVNFESRPHQDPSIKGQYSPGSGIWVRPEEPRAQQLKSLLHELAHYYSEGVFRIPRRDAETIAESGAFAVGAHFGFDSGTRSFPYVALWSQDKKVLQANLASIRKVATVMLEGLEKTPGTEEKLVPALKPFEPYHFAEYVLRFNRFSDAEIPIYSGLTGRSPLRVPDHIWREVIEATEGEFVKQGDINIFHIPEKGRPDYMRAAPTWRDIASTLPTGTCYEDAWRFLIKEEEGDLVHGTVWNGDKRIGHAWVETDTGYIWEPETKKFYTKLGFENAAGPVEQHRYTPIEASIMAARTKNFGPWTDDEVLNYLKRKVAATIPTEPSTPSPREELEFVSDSPELIPFTIEDIGYRDKLDNAFEAAIARAKGD